MRNIGFALLFVVITAGFRAREAHGQMFGSRSLGNTLSRQPGPGSAASGDVGGLSGNERYLRGNRRSGSFVGRDRTGSRGFVGLEQGTAAGNVASATQGLRIQQTPSVSVNQPRAGRQPTDVYDPRLEIGFPVTRPDPSLIQQGLTLRLREESANGRFETIVVSLEGETATLRGTVASANDRAVAEALVLFEPGVAAVRNELQVRPDPPQPNP